MLQTIEATIDEDGAILLAEPVKLSGPRRALVTILSEEPSADGAAVVSEPALALEWNRPEEDEAWSQLGCRG